MKKYVLDKLDSSARKVEPKGNDFRLVFPLNTTNDRVCGICNAVQNAVLITSQ